MASEQQNGASRPAGGAAVPVPVPEWPEAPAAGVSDEDRQRFGLLLDRAAERGLLPPSEYQIRLRELAEATSVEQMTRIVTELPAFNAPSVGVAGPARGASSAPADGLLPGTGGRSERRRANPWVMLVVMVVVVAVALVVLGLYAEHLVHNKSSGTGTLQGIGVTLSSLRL